MHWFWRAVIAASLGSALGTVWCSVTFTLFSPPANFIQFVVAMDEMLRPVGGGYLGFAVVYMLPPVIIAVVTYGLLTRFFGPRRTGGETRCRKCGYILRGLTEPRCSECGERI